MNELKNKSKFLRDVWYLTKSYWQSEEKGKAYLLLTAIIALTLGVVYMLVLLNKWNNSFYNALQNYQTELIFDELIHFGWAGCDLHYSGSLCLLFAAGTGA